MAHRGDSRTRILLYFLLGILLPSGLLGYLAFRGIQNERALVERERRTELETVADRMTAAIESRLLELERTVQSARPEELSGLARKGVGIQAVFTTDPAGEVRIVAAEGLFFEHEPAPDGGSARQTSHPLLEQAERRELVDRDLRGALDLYLRTVEESDDERVRARAFSGTARTQHRLGWLPRSIESYERLYSEFGDVRSTVGVPYGAAAALELGTIHLERGDTARAVRVALDLYGDVVRGRWLLTPARFDLLASSGRTILEPLAGVGVLPWLADTLESLSSVEAQRRAEAIALRRFEENAGRLLLRARRNGGPTRGSIDIGTRSFPAVLLPTRSGQRDSTHRGWIVDPLGLARHAVSAAIGESANRFSWRLQAPEGEVVASSQTQGVPDTPTVATALVGFPTWTLHLAHSREAFVGSFLASRQAAYLCAFILIAGILVSGLVLTLRTVGRELELARMKSDFVSTVSHEFKSPLTAIRQLAEMLRTGRVTSEERRNRYYDVLLEQSERLSRLVDNVLDFARMEAGRRELSPEATDPTPLVEEIVAEARQRVSHEQFTIRSELARPLPMAALDRDAFHQALSNLIDNGVKYSGQSREVVVHGYPENGSLVVAVQDFGVGMAPDEATRAFERFYRGGAEMTRTVKGTGLGLTLVKKIVEAHGGTVEVRSEPGRGSTFTLRFPAAEPKLQNGPGPASGAALER